MSLSTSQTSSLLEREDGLKSVTPSSENKQERKNKGRNRCTRLLVDNLILILTMVGVVIGIGLGLFLSKCKLTKETIRLISFPGEIFMNMLKMMILPLITTSLITGMAQLGGKSSRKMLTIAFTYYMSTTVIAVVTGLLLVLLIHPGDPNLAQSRNETEVTGNKTQIKVSTSDTIMDILRNLFPPNVAQAFLQASRTVYKEVTHLKRNSTNETETEHKHTVVYMDGPNIVGLITICMAVGACLSKLGKKSAVVVEFICVVGECVNTFIRLMMWFSPIGIASLLIGKLVQAPEFMSLLAKLAWLTLTVFIGTSIHFFITLPLLYCVFARRNPFKLFKAMMPAIMTALATSSSAATLPVTLMCAETRLGIQKAVSNFVLSVGATINMDGSALYEAVGAIFIAQLNNIDLSLGQMITISITSTLTSIGAAAMPTAGLVTFIIVLQSAGLPINDIPLLLTIDWILDRYRTVLNITGDVVGAAIVDRYVKVKEVNEEKDKSDINPEKESTEESEIKGL